MCPRVRFWRSSSTDWARNTLNFVPKVCPWAHFGHFIAEFFPKLYPDCKLGTKFKVLHFAIFVPKICTQIFIFLKLVIVLAQMGTKFVIGTLRAQNIWYCAYGYKGAQFGHKVVRFGPKMCPQLLVTLWSHFLCTRYTQTVPIKTGWAQNKALRCKS